MRWLCTLCVMVATLAGCGFEPVYQQRPERLDGAEVLKNIHIETTGGRDGDQLKAVVEDRFRQTQSPVNPRYRLVLSPQIKSRPFIIDPDGISSRYEVTVRAQYQLRRRSDDTLLHRGDIRRQVSYNVSEQDDYATYIAERDARKRGIEALGNDLALRVAALLAKASQ